MKFRDKRTGEIKHLEIERETFVCLTAVDNWYDTYQAGFDDKLLELIEATPNQRRALRRAGFTIKPAAEMRIRSATQNAASRHRAKRARANQKARQSRIATSSTESAASPIEMHKAA